MRAVTITCAAALCLVVAVSAVSVVPVAQPSAPAAPPKTCCADGHWQHRIEAFGRYGATAGRMYSANVTYDFQKPTAKLRIDYDNAFPMTTLVIDSTKKMLFAVDSEGNCDLLHNVVVSPCFEEGTKLVGNRTIAKSLQAYEWLYLSPRHEPIEHVTGTDCFPISQRQTKVGEATEINYYNHVKDTHQSKYFEPPAQCLARSAAPARPHPRFHELIALASQAVPHARFSETHQ